MAKAQIRFFDDGIQGILKSPGASSICHSLAIKKAAELSAKNGVEYEVVADPLPSRVRYRAQRPMPIPRERNLTHEQWMADLWPRVGGAPWRPNSGRH